MRVENDNPKMKQPEIANQLRYSTSTLQRYKNDINMLSPYRIHPNNTNKRINNGKITNFDNNSHCDLDLKRPQMTSKNLKMTSKTLENRKKKLKGGPNIEINEHYLDEVLQNNNT